MHRISLRALILALALAAFAGPAITSNITESVLGAWENEDSRGKIFTLTEHQLTLPDGLTGAVDLIKQKDGTVRVVNEGSSYLLRTLTLVDPDHMNIVSILNIGGSYVRVRQDEPVRN